MYVKGWAAQRVVGLAAVFIGSLVWVVGCGDPVQTGTVVSASSAGVSIKVAGDAKGEWKPVAANQAIGFEDELKVEGKDSYVKLKLSDNTRIMLVTRADPADPKKRLDTLFSIQGFKQQTSYRALVMKLKQGIAALIVPKNRPSGDVLEVQASFTTTAIRGTELKVDSCSSGDTVSVKEGVVEVSSNANPTQILKVEQLFTVHVDSKVGKAEKYDPVSNDAERELYNLDDAPTQKHF
jgi:hypothetical protein